MMVTIVQARMGSTRLPGKVLEDLAGRPMLERVVRRAGRAQLVHKLVVATTRDTADDPVAALCASLGVPAVRGPTDDVLARYAEAAAQHEATAIVRITADCPFIDPAVVDEVVGAFNGARADYASNVIERSYPRGLDVEVFSRRALDAAAREATTAEEREHVTPFIRTRTARFPFVSVRGEADRSDLRMTVDEPADLALARAVYQRLGGDDVFSWQDAARVIDADPALRALNQHVRQKPVSGA